MEVAGFAGFHTEVLDADVLRIVACPDRITSTPITSVDTARTPKKVRHPNASVSGMPIAKYAVMARL